MECNDQIHFQFSKSNIINQMAIILQFKLIFIFVTLLFISLTFSQKVNTIIKNLKDKLFLKLYITEILNG